MGLVSAMHMAAVPGASAAEAATPERVEVASFGAVVNDGKDDREAFLNAFEACSKLPASVLVLEKGVYDIDQKEDEPLTTITFFLENIPNLTIEGNGAELLARTWHPLFRIHDSANLVVKDLKVDWNPVPHTAGEVIERNPEDRSFVIRVTPGYRPTFAAPVDLIVGYDPVQKIPNQVATGDNFLFTQNQGPLTEVLGEDTMRVRLSNKPRTVTPHAAKVVVPELGSSVAIRFKARGSTAFLFQRCDKLRVENVDIYSAPGMGLTMLNSVDVHLKGVRVIPRPGADRWMSTCVDATHFKMCRGQIVMEDCVFEGMEDDGSNVGNMYMRLHGRKGPRTAQLECGRGYAVFQPDPDPRVGDTLEFGSQANPYIAGFEAKIVEVSSIPTRPDGKAKLFTVTLDRDMPELPKDTLVGNASAVPDLFVMRNTVVKGNRGYGIRVITRNAIVEDCRFENILGGAILMQCLMEKTTNAAEGISNRNNIVRNNRIYRCGAMLGSAGGAIMMDVGLNNQSHRYPYVHEEVTIENNLIEDAFGYGISLKSAADVRVLGNTIVNPRNSPVFIGSSRNIVVRGNRFVLPAERAGEPVVTFGRGNDQSTLTVENNNRVVENASTAAGTHPPKP